MIRLKMADGIVLAGLRQMNNGIPFDKIGEDCQKIDVAAMYQYFLSWGLNGYIHEFIDDVQSFNDVFVYISSFTGEFGEFTFNTESKVEQCIKTVEKYINIDMEVTSMRYHGIQMNEEKQLWEYGVTSGDTILLDLQLKGDRPSFTISNQILDPVYDCIYPNFDFVKFERGGYPFERPTGWTKKALKVNGIYESNDWLGLGSVALGNPRLLSVPNEWAVSYHGTNKGSGKQIGKEGYDLSKGQRFMYGVGIYSTPSPSTAERFADVFEYEGETYKMMMMNRVLIAKTKVEHLPNNEVYFVTPDQNDIRPYAFLIKKV